MAAIHTDTNGLYWWNGEQHNVIARGGYLFNIYASLDGAQKVARIVRVELATGTVDGPVTIGDITDYHETPSIILLDNRVVALKGSYGSDTYKYAQYAEAPDTYDSDDWSPVTSWSNLPLPATGTSGYIYPLVYEDGTVLIPALERAGNNYVPGTDAYFYKKEPGQTWTQGTWTRYVLAPGNVAINGYTPAVYALSPVLRKLANGTERLAITLMCFRPALGVFDTTSTVYHGCAYIYTDDKGETWRKADGTALTVPINTASVSDATLWCHQSYAYGYYGIAIADDGTPTVSVDTFTVAGAGTSGAPLRKAANGVTVYRWNGASWDSVVVDDDTVGTPRSLASPKAILAPDGTVRVLAFSDIEGESHWEALKHYSIDVSFTTASLVGRVFDDSATNNSSWRRVQDETGTHFAVRNYDPSGAGGGFAGTQLEYEVIQGILSYPTLVIVESPRLDLAMSIFEPSVSVTHIRSYDLAPHILPNTQEYDLAPYIQDGAFVASPRLNLVLTTYSPTVMTQRSVSTTVPRLNLAISTYPPYVNESSNQLLPLFMGAGF